MRSIIMGIMLFLAPFGLAAQDQPASCNLRADVVENLKTHWNESLAYYGLITGGISVFEIFTSPEGTFTAVYTTPTGRSCVITTGKIWQKHEPQKEGKEL
tara:strand:+ start:317 stop:616 length:300 start_codon:yes stop_codon:yes gene_type:complete